MGCKQLYRKKTHEREGESVMGGRKIKKEIRKEMFGYEIVSEFVRMCCWNPSIHLQRHRAK